MTERPEYKNWITSGNVITLAVLLGTGLVAWGVTSTTLTTHAKTLDDHEARLRAMESVEKKLSIIEYKLDKIEKAVLK